MQIVLGSGCGSGTVFVRYAEVIANCVRDFAELPIVVAHSASGLFLPIAATLRPVSRLVFLAAFVPEVGRSPMQQFQASADMFWPDWIGKDPTKDDAVARHFLFHDCAPETAAWALTTRKLMFARGALTNTFPLERWPDVPIWYILCREDRTLRADFWREYCGSNWESFRLSLPVGTALTCPVPEHWRMSWTGWVSFSWCHTSSSPGL